jgi:hypothetical protein
LTEQHTKEPWEVERVEGQRVRLVKGDERCIAAVPDRDQAYADFCRIVACVNACEGLEPEKLKEFVKACELWEQARATGQGYKISQAERSLVVRLAWVKGKPSP